MILSDNETKLDLLNNKAIATTVVSIIKESKESVSIGVHGDWGAGKSSILAMVEELLKPEQDDDSLLNDDKDWEEWDESDPEGATDKEPDVASEGYITIRFNSWQYQGFEDAKIALMSAIIKALQEKAKEFYKKHPVKGALKKLKNICKNVWKNLDKLGLAKNVGKVGVALATGTAPLALLDIATKYAKDIFTDETKRNEFITTAGALLKDTTTEPSCYKEMREFRTNYQELFKAAHVEKLIVLIDDLDRCLPKVAIETLEAIRMFLSMEKTAFIIAADDEMIKYSVREYFPRISEQQRNETEGITQEAFRDFSEKYLEKLIQVPLHIPIIGVTEAQLYVTLLFVESELGETEGFSKLVETIIEKLHKPWSLKPITPEEIKEALGADYEQVADNIKIAKSIDRILAENTAGNPRNIKRFINMLLLRTKIAHNRGFDELEMAKLAKIMLIEQYNYDFYKAIANELREDGSCAAFDVVEKKEEKDEIETEEGKEINPSEGKGTTSKKKTTKKSSAEVKQSVTNEAFEKMLEESKVKAWMEIEPSLAGVDLRPYFFACKEFEDFFFINTDEQLRELAAIIRGGRLNVSNNKKKFTDLGDVEARKLFGAISQDAFNRDLSKSEPPKVIDGIRRYVEYRVELQDALVDFLMTLPTQRIGAWALGGWDACIPKTSPARPKLMQFFTKIGNTSDDPLIKSKVKQIQE